MTKLVAGVEDLVLDMRAWRRDIHAHPETAFEEHRTSALVAEVLRSLDLDVHTGLGGTGVVATLGDGKGPVVGLRADMDALHIQETTNATYRSTIPGKMHACGHDGHTAMLLGAAKFLAANPPQNGTVRFIFQPAEENEGGGKRMVEEGLFDLFPVDAVYGLHNWPHMPFGLFSARPGPVMAAYDIFEITITGKGAHAAMPHDGVDPVVTASHVVMGLQTIASRNTHPLDSVVVSITQIHGGDTWNVIPETVVMRGTVRSFKDEVRSATEKSIRRIVSGICAAKGAACKINYERRYPATVNHGAETEIAAATARTVVGDAMVSDTLPPSMGSEDFAYMLEKAPGAYVWLGTSQSDGTASLHNPAYDFNDNALATGASYWVRLVESCLKERPKG